MAERACRLVSRTVAVVIVVVVVSGSARHEPPARSEAVRHRFRRVRRRLAKSNGDVDLLVSQFAARVRSIMAFDRNDFVR